MNKKTIWNKAPGECFEPLREARPSLRCIMDRRGLSLLPEPLSSSAQRA